jgi:hypothetical protein
VTKKHTFLNNLSDLSAFTQKECSSMDRKTNLVNGVGVSATASQHKIVATKNILTSTEGNGELMT